MARPSLLRYVKARYTTDGSAPSADSAEWHPGMALEDARQLTVAYQASNQKLGKATSIRLDKESPAQWRVIATSCGFPDNTVGLDVKKISIARARNAFDANPSTAFRANNSSTSGRSPLWVITVDRQPGKQPMPEITHLTVPASKHERKNVNDSAKTILVEQSSDGEHWSKIAQGLIEETRVVPLRKPATG